MSEKVIPESLYSSAIRRQVLRKRPSPSFIMLALWTAVTCYSAKKGLCERLIRKQEDIARLTFRLFLIAKSKANRAIRSDLYRVMIFNDSTTPGED